MLSVVCDERIKRGWDEPTMLLPMGVCKSVNKDLVEEEEEEGKEK